MDNKKYYENFNWESVTKDKLNPFLEVIQSSIPQEVTTIIDVGCGNGIITNELASRYEITGLDRSEKSLEFVRTRKICASADAIPLPDNSFDLVMTTEMMEHLEDETFKNTAGEIKRLSKKYILITVPDNEDIDKNFIKCPHCNHIFNFNYHLQKISRQTLEELFSDHQLIKYARFGTKVRPYKSLLSRIKRKTSPSSAWIASYWKQNEERHSLCPRCEKEFAYPYQFNLMALFIDGINILVSPKRPYYHMCIFEKRN
jgi:SAM-dependent methyltransferase